MNSPKSPGITTSPSPLRESTWNTQVEEGITPSSSWSTTSSTSPLRISKDESPLTSDTIPKPHYHKLHTQLARRQSSSYTHVRNNALVSNSPFKRSGVKPSRIPTPSRAIPKDDENKPEHGFRRRQSRGLQGLFKEQVVTKSPFLGDKRSGTTPEVPPPSTPVPVSPPGPPHSSVSPQTETVEPQSSSTPCTSVTPRNPRVADLCGRSLSPSPKSSLVSPKRLHGPRSLSASPASDPSKRQRRKTVTFDERCDVLEFDQDEVSEEVIDTEEDEYSLTEPPSPAISASTDGSFASYTSDDSGVAAPFDLSDPGVDLGEMHSALDRLMLGVESGFGIEPTEGESMDTTTEGDISANINISSVDVIADNVAKSIGQEIKVHEQLKETHIHPNMTRMSQIESTDEDTNETATQSEHNEHQRPTRHQEGRPSRRSSSPMDNAEDLGSSTHAEIESADKDIDRPVTQPECNEYQFSATSHEERPSRRRSLSTGDAEDLGSSTPAAKRRASRLRDDLSANLLDVSLEQEDEEQALGDLIDRELKIRRRPTIKKNRMYKLRERENTIYASSDDKVSHMSQAGDIDNGKAWRTVRRPSDMNEYSRQIKEYRAQHKPGKGHGKVFVKVLGIRGVNVPLPSQPTYFTCTLNNGIHYVTTPDCRLSRDARIEQEFELIEHSKLEFTLTLTIRRDSHITAQAKSNASPPAAIPVALQPPPSSSSSRGGVRGFFSVGSSPKKTHKVAVAAAVRATPEPVEDNIARYVKPDGTLARAFVSFKEIAKRCDTRLFETSFPLIGQRTGGSSSHANPWTMGEIVLQIFRLPPLPGIESDKLPQSLEECHRGLRHINWHKVTYHEGILTQNGGDCRTWRRRLLRVIGSSLVAFNDVTKKATATIDLKKAIAVEDDDPMFPAIKSPSAAAPRSRDEFDEVYRVERSFRLLFPNDEEITFFADNDEAKARWLEVLRALVGHIPPHPLWAELIWQRQEEISKSSESIVPQSAPPHPSAAPH